MEYRNLDLETLDYADNGGVETFRVRVQASPVGEQKLSVVRTIPAGLRQRLRSLEGRRLTLAEIISLGEQLADLLLPAQVRAIPGTQSGKSHRRSETTRQAAFRRLRPGRYALGVYVPHRCRHARRTTGT